MKSHPLALAFALALCPLFAVTNPLSACFASPLWQEQEEKEAESGTTGQKTEEESQDQDGEADLDKALELNVTAKSTRDLDRVAELCESAIEKGLDESGILQAKQIWVSALMEYANQLSARVFDPEGRDRRWQKFRRDSLTRLRKVIELNPELADAWLLIARLNGLPGGDSEEARNAIEKAIELAGDDKIKLSNALFIRATLSEDNESILGDLEQAIKIDPQNMDAIRFRGAYYLRQGEPEKAIEDFKKFLESEEDNLGAYFLVVETLRSIEKYDEAMEILDKAVDVDPDNSATFVIRAQVQLDQENYDAAVEEATRAIKLDRNNFSAILLRAQALFSKEDYEPALADVQLALDEEPRSVGALHLRAMILASTEDYEQAIDDLETLVRGVPNNLAYQIQLASVYNANLEPKRSVRIYNRLIDQLPENSPVLLNVFRGRGDARLSLGEHEGAIEDYDRALEFDPDDDHTLNNLAWVLATSPYEELRDGKRSVELATKACEVTNWEAAHILSTLASGYAESGDFDSAKKFLKQGLEIAESDKQRASMTNELEHYERGEPFRELQDIEQERAERDQARSGKDKDDQAATEDSGSDDGDQGSGSGGDGDRI